MSYTNKNNKGALFKNKSKENEKHPDYKGSINVNGVDYWISAWLTESNKGVKYMSLACTLNDKPSENHPNYSTGARPQQNNSQPQEEEDGPF